MWLLYLATTAVGYLFGSLPTGYLVGRRYGLDIRAHGSGNIGATNVGRVLGRKPGLFVFVCDCLKGFLAVRAAYALIWYFVLGRQGVADPGAPIPGTYLDMTLMVPPYQTGAAVLAALAGILGHNFPVWLGFRGGKGVATTTGVLLGLMPAAVAIAALVWAAAFFALRYVSVASLLAAATLPLTVGLLWWIGHADPLLFSFSLAATGLAFWRHRTNLQRLLAGTEPRFVFKR